MNATEQEQHRLLGLLKGYYYRRIAAIESQQIELAGINHKPITCDIEGCRNDQKVLHLVDDNGVNVWLCDTHYKEHLKWKKQYRKDLKKAGIDPESMKIRRK